MVVVNTSVFPQYLAICIFQSGMGGFGLVSLVERRYQRIVGSSSELEIQHFAMKSLSKQSILRRPSGVSSVLTELRALTIMEDHPLICNIQCAFQDNSFLYLVIEFVSGGDMRNNIRKMEHCRYPEATAKFYACVLIKAVSACHQANILHRDVKPENILLTGNGYLKLTDFGVAKILPDIEDCRSTSGTHGYMVKS